MFALFYKRSDVVDLRMKACYKLIPWFWWGWSSIPKVPKIASFQCLYDISKKKLEMKLIFGMQINVKVFYKLISTLLASNFSIGWYYHYWWAWSSILKVLKVTSLQYLYNILKTVRFNGSWSWFTTRFWIFTTKFVVIICCFHDKVKIIKSMELSMDLWHSDNIKVIVTL